MKKKPADWFAAVQAIQINTPLQVAAPPFVSIDLWNEIHGLGVADAIAFIADEMITVGMDGRRAESSRVAVHAALADLAKRIAKSALFKNAEKVVL